MKEREGKLNVVFNFNFDGNDLSIYLGDHDVTSVVKKQIGKEEFYSLESSFIPKERDRYREHVDRQLEEAGI